MFARLSFLDSLLFRAAASAGRIQRPITQGRFAMSIRHERLSSHRWLKFEKGCRHPRVR
jgi:hypothetical protein